MAVQSKVNRRSSFGVGASVGALQSKQKQSAVNRCLFISMVAVLGAMKSKSESEREVLRVVHRSTS